MTLVSSFVTFFSVNSMQHVPIHPSHLTIIIAQTVVEVEVSERRVSETSIWFAVRVELDVVIWDLIEGYLAAGYYCLSVQWKEEGRKDKGERTVVIPQCC
jgi:hypothetical protein